MTDLDPGALTQESVVVRQLREEDLAAIVRIDRASIGRARPLYYQAKVKRILTEGKLQTSLVAEVDGLPVGFVLTTLNYGEFGQTEPAAVIDSIGVMPAFRGRGAGDALVKQLEMNMRALGVERIETQVGWDQRELLTFLAKRGFDPAPRFCLQLRLT